MRLVRVIAGLYRSEDGRTLVTHRPKWRGKPAHWAVRFKNGYSAECVREFPTLAEVRRFLAPVKEAR